MENYTNKTQEIYEQKYIFAPRCPLQLVKLVKSNPILSSVSPELDSTLACNLLTRDIQ